MTTLHGSALAGLERLLSTLPAPADAEHEWRLQVRTQLLAVRHQVVHLPTDSSVQTAARASAVIRERSVLLGRLARAHSLVKADRDLQRLTYEMRRLVADIHRHVQRAHDLAYDEVELELGGSE